MDFFEVGIGRGLTGIRRILPIWRIGTSHTPDFMVMYPVSPLVNSVRNESVDLVLPVGMLRFSIWVARINKSEIDDFS